MEFTYRGIKYQSNLSSKDRHHSLISLIQTADFLSNHNKPNFFIWRGVSYSKNFDRHLGLKREC